MFLDETKNFNVISVLELSWKNNKRYAKPRPFHALSFRIHGDADFEHGENVYHVESGDVAFVPKGYEYSMNHKEEYLYVVHFDMSGDEAEDFLSITPADKYAMKDLFRKMYEIWNRKETGYQFAATSVFYTILEHLKKEVSNNKSQLASSKMNEVIDYINTNYQDGSLTVAKLAQLFGTSDTFFRKEFKRMFGETPLRYINNIRLKRAEELLQTGYYSVGEVSSMVGFCDPKYFSRFIKKEKNISPSKMK